MRAYKKYKQLKLCVDNLNDHYSSVALAFKLNKEQITGILIGSYEHWEFRSNSTAFLKHIPSGILCKYSVWMDGIPKELTKLYNGIWEAAIRAGYDLSEKELL